MAHHQQRADPTWEPPVVDASDTDTSADDADDEAEEDDQGDQEREENEEYEYEYDSDGDVDADADADADADNDVDTALSGCTLDQATISLASPPLPPPPIPHSVEAPPCASLDPRDLERLMNAHHPVVCDSPPTKKRLCSMKSNGTCPPVYLCTDEIRDTRIRLPAGFTLCSGAGKSPPRATSTAPLTVPETPTPLSATQSQLIDTAFIYLGGAPPNGPVYRSSHASAASSENEPGSCTTTACKDKALAAACSALKESSPNLTDLASAISSSVCYVPDIQKDSSVCCKRKCRPGDDTSARMDDKVPSPLQASRQLSRQQQILAAWKIKIADRSDDGGCACEDDGKAPIGGPGATRLTPSPFNRFTVVREAQLAMMRSLEGTES